MNKIVNVLLVYSLSIVVATATPKASLTPLFSPDDKPTRTLIELINNAQTSIHAAVYMLTDKTIAQALINAHARKIDVKIIIDPISIGKFGKADFLKDGGVEVYVFNPATTTKIAEPDKWFSSEPIMHNKFAIFDNKIIWTGSFNWTASANRMNAENVVYAIDKEACQCYEQYFNKLLTQRCQKHAAGVASLAKGQGSLHDEVINALQQTASEEALLQKLMDLMQKYHTSIPEEN